MFQKIIINLVIAFILRQIKKFGETVNWDLVKADLDKRIADILPGTWIDAEAVTVANYVFDACKAALGATDNLKSIMVHLANEDWPGAIAAVKDLLLLVWQGQPTKTTKQDQTIADVLALDWTKAAA